MVTTGMSEMNSGPGNGSEERTDQPGSDVEKDEVEQNESEPLEKDLVELLI